MKPEHFRNKNIPLKICCTTCVNFRLLKPSDKGMTPDIAGINESKCVKHDFIVASMRYMSIYEAEKCLCDDYNLMR